MDKTVAKKAYAALDLAYSQLDEMVDEFVLLENDDAVLEFENARDTAETARDVLENYIDKNADGYVYDIPALSFELPAKKRRTPPARLNQYPVVGYAPTARTMHKFAHVAIVDVTRGNTAAQYAVVNWWPDLGYTWHASEYCRTIAEAVQMMGARV